MAFSSGGYAAVLRSVAAAPAVVVPAPAAVAAAVVSAGVAAVEAEEDYQDKNDDPPVAVSEAIHRVYLLHVVF